MLSSCSPPKRFASGARAYEHGRSARVFAARFVAGAALFFGERRALADSHEGISIFPPTGTLRLGAESEATAFDLNGQHGSFISGIPRVEYTPMHLMNLRVRVPIHSLSLEGDPALRTGIGDVELRLRLNLWRTEPLHLSAGWVVQMPTGSKHEGLGEGAVQITPFVSAGFRIDKVVLYLTVADNMSLGVHEQRFVNYVDPSEPNEVRTTGGTILPITESVSSSAFLTETTILSHAERWDSLLTGGIQIGMQPDPRLRIVVSDQVPLAGQHRFSWKMNAAVSYAL